jgi:hypothetical protein
LISEKKPHRLLPVWFFYALRLAKVAGLFLFIFFGKFRREALAVLHDRFAVDVGSDALRTP